MTAERADAIVLFGATGDLAKKKLWPALYSMFRQAWLDVPIIGVGRSAWDDEQLRAYARQSVDAAPGPAVEDSTFTEFAARLSMHVGDYADPHTHQQLADRLGPSASPLFYLAIPPSVFPPVVNGLASVGLAERGRVVIEKPFGRDRASARELNAALSEAFTEHSIFRIDHYLGKESVEGLMCRRRGPYRAASPGCGSCCRSPGRRTREVCSAHTASMVQHSKCLPGG
jgi:glucose-6-phosphate 1-dehydrogenase